MIKKIILVFIILLAIVICSIFFISNSKEKISFNDVELKLDDYKALKEIYQDDVGFYVCNLNNSNCIRFINIDNFNEEINKIDYDNGGTK